MPDCYKSPSSFPRIRLPFLGKSCLLGACKRFIRWDCFGASRFAMITRKQFCRCERSDVLSLFGLFQEAHFPSVQLVTILGKRQDGKDFRIRLKVQEHFFSIDVWRKDFDTSFFCVWRDIDISEREYFTQFTLQVLASSSLARLLQKVFLMCGLFRIL